MSKLVNTIRPASGTKIVATVGPACDSIEKLVELIQAGVDVFRLNMAHGDLQQQFTRLAAIRGASARAGQTVAVLVDLAGPKIRLGELPGGQATLHTGDRVRFVRAISEPDSPAAASPPENALDMTVTYAPLLDELEPGNRVMLADGTVSLLVRQVTSDFAECEVIQPGLIRSRQGVNLPGVKLSVAALSDIDQANAVWAAQNEIDFVGLSFVRTASDVRQLKSLLASHGASAQVIAKIEKPEALDHLEGIVAEADGVMVARGDLGVEIDIARVAVVQKEIIALCNRCRKPVITATQMLDSMQHSRLPTRAEVADVANAILDGTDACMLSGETAIGEYPREAVEMMHRIALATEPLAKHPVLPNGQPARCADLNPVTEASVSAAGGMAEELGARALIVATASGATALTLSKRRLAVPVVGVSDAPAVLRRMCLYRGIMPLAGVPTVGPAALLEHVVRWGADHGLLAAGDRVVLIAGTGLAVTRHNLIVAHEISEWPPD